MDSLFSKPARVQGIEKVRPVREKAFKIPEDNGGECQEYVTGIKYEAPFEYFHLGGINFEKMVWPSDFSLVQNQNKIFRPKYLIFALTPKQAEAIWAEASTREVVIPATHNPKYDEKSADKEPEFLPAFITPLANWIILEPKETFSFAKPDKETDAKKFLTVTPDIKTELLEQQKQVSKKGK